MRTNVKKKFDRRKFQEPVVQAIQPKQFEPLHREPQIDKLGRAYATGKRKNAIARVWIKKGTGKIIINGKPHQSYFARPVLKMILNQPFQVTNTEGAFDIHSTVTGGGLSGQAGALKHGITRAMINFNPELRTFLKQAGFVTRDPREVERQKPGRSGARRRYQFSKR